MEIVSTFEEFLRKVETKEFRLDLRPKLKGKLQIRAFLFWILQNHFQKFLQHYQLSLNKVWKYPPKREEEIKIIKKIWKKYKGLKTSEIFKIFKAQHEKKLYISGNIEDLPPITRQGLNKILRFLNKKGFIYKHWKGRGSFASWKIRPEIAITWYFPGKIIPVAGPPKVEEVVWGIAIKRTYMPEFYHDPKTWYEIHGRNLWKFVIENGNFWDNLKKALEVVEKLRYQSTITVEEAKKIGWKEILLAEEFGFVECEFGERIEGEVGRPLIGFRLRDEWYTYLQNISKILEILKKLNE